MSDRSGDTAGGTAGGSGEAPAVIVYDGECPFCTRYVAMLRLKAAFGNVRLVDARSGDPAVQRIFDAGLDLDEGMALIQGEHIYHGDDCIHRLALMSTPSTLFNKLNGAIFRSPTASRLLYPILRCGRNTALLLLGRRKISAD
jgi:predicted DCC family thiol-disulfide oxidoreductase YuxK